MAAPKRFFAERIGGEMLLPAEQSRHAKNVLRLTEGEEVTLFDGSGREYSAVVTKVDRSGVSVHVVREAVSDREYVSNGFHCHVTEDITPIEKQDLEYRFWELCNGGKIQYVKYPIDYNLEAVKTLIRRAMDKGYYEGVNLSLAYCDDCGHQELEMDVCPKCGSRNLTKIDRMNGYLSYSRVHGDTRLNDAKMAEIAERKSM